MIENKLKILEEIRSFRNCEVLNLEIAHLSSGETNPDGPSSRNVRFLNLSFFALHHDAKFRFTKI